jgi:hypothetical protein
MSLQLLDSDSPVETSAPSPSPSFSSSGKPTWSTIEKTLRQWGDMKAVSDEQVSQVKGELGPLFKKSGIEFDNFRIKCDRDDPRGISAVSPDGWVHVEFQRNSSSCPSLMSFTLDELRNEWSSQKSGSAGEAAAPSKRRPMKEERAIEIARAAINSKGNMDIMPRSISDEDLKEAYGMLKNAKDGSVGTRSNQFYYGNDLMTIDQIRNLSKAIGMLLL